VFASPSPGQRPGAQVTTVIVFNTEGVASLSPGQRPGVTDTNIIVFNTEGVGERCLVHLEAIGLANTFGVTFFLNRTLSQGVALGCEL
jgi:hypothetical protein